MNSLFDVLARITNIHNGLATVSNNNDIMLTGVDDINLDDVTPAFCFTVGSVKLHWRDYKENPHFYAIQTYDGRKQKWSPTVNISEFNDLIYNKDFNGYLTINPYLAFLGSNAVTGEFIMLKDDTNPDSLSLASVSVRKVPSLKDVMPIVVVIDDKTYNSIKEAMNVISGVCSK